jgi:hypothetical protein
VAGVLAMGVDGMFVVVGAGRAVVRVDRGIRLGVDVRRCIVLALHAELAGGMLVVVVFHVSFHSLARK